MGTIQHNAIIVTSWDDKSLDAAKQKIIDIWGLYEDYHPVIFDSELNSTKSIFIPPDGSKEGWEASDIGDERRKAFKDWITKIEKDPENEIYLDVVDVAYGECGTELEFSNCNL